MKIYILFLCQIKLIVLNNLWKIFCIQNYNCRRVKFFSNSKNIWLLLGMNEKHLYTKGLVLCVKSGLCIIIYTAYLFINNLIQHFI